MSIKTFRGLIANDTQVRIRLGTNQGLIGYKIKKFELIGINENTDYETTVKIFTQKQDATSLSADITFDDPLLLAAGLYGDSTSGTARPLQTIVFDSMKFNQDIYVTHKASRGTTSINYYIELEQMNLSLDEAAVATLKDMRGRE